MRRQPWVWLRQLRPCALIQPGANQQIGRLQAGFKQAENGYARVAAISGPDGNVGEHCLEQVGPGRDLPI